MASEPIYRINFLNQGQVYEIFARHVFQSDLWGFLEVEEFLFGERSQMIVDPAEEKLKNEFADIKRSFIPMQSIIRIDEVEKEGAGKITEAKGGNVSPFPFPLWSEESPRLIKVGRLASEVLTKHSPLRLLCKNEWKNSFSRT